MADAAAAAVATAALGLPTLTRQGLSSNPLKKKDDAMDARDFVTKVEAYRNVARLIDAETVKAVQYACVPKPSTAHWQATLAKEDPEAVVD